MTDDLRTIIADIIERNDDIEYAADDILAARWPKDCPTCDGYRVDDPNIICPDCWPLEELIRTGMAAKRG